MENWKLCEARQRPLKIPPLEWSPVLRGVWPKPFPYQAFASPWDSLTARAGRSTYPDLFWATGQGFTWTTG